jgi:hypothetical protein
MPTLYTKNGRPLKQSADNLYSASGTHVAKLRGKKAHGPDGRYVGTLSGNRLVYRSTDASSMGSSFAQSNRAGTASARSVGSAIAGDEPPIPD